MRVRGARKASLTGGLVLAVLVTIPVAFAVPRPELAGTVRDAVGSFLGDVEVLILRERGADPVAVTHTDPQGRFLVPDLAVGTYRVVAVKDGYTTWLGRVSVALRTSLDLVLQPEVDDPTLDPSWALRVPDRGLLRETDAVALLAPAGSEGSGSGGPTVARVASDRLVQGKLDHVFAFGADEVAGPRAHMDGGDTRVSLRSHPGERTHIRLEGGKQTLESTPGAGLARRTRESSGFALDLDYDTSLDGQLAVRAYYASRDSDLSASSRPSRVFGYDATWARQLAPDSRLTVDLAYLDAGGDQRLPVGPVPMSGRAMRAGTAFETRLVKDHQLRVALRARSADLDALSLISADPLPGPGQIAVSSGVPDPLGWGLRLDVEDAWQVSAPVTLVYALGYEADVTGVGTGWFVQRAGAVWSEADLRLELHLSRHALVASAAGSPSLEDPIGWSASVEVPLLPNLRLRAEALDSPMQDEGLPGRMGGAVLERPAYLSDGLASTRQRRLTLQHDARLTRAFVQVERGAAEGLLAVVRPADLTVGELDGQQVDFLAGRLGVRVVPTGTDVSAEYRRVLATGPVDGECVELRIAQDLARHPSRGAAWRLLLAARATQDGSAEAEGFGDGTQHWMGAGISLAF